MPIVGLSVIAVLTGLVAFFFDAELADEKVKQEVRQAAAAKTRIERIHECIRLIAWIDVSLMSLYVILARL